MHRSPEDNQKSLDVSPIRLRTVTTADLDVLFELQSDPESNDMAGTKPRTRDGFVAIWHSHLTDPTISARVIEMDSDRGPEIAGSISRFVAEGHDAIGYWIGRGHWGQGVASRALAMFLSEEHRRPLHATAATSNVASLRILEKCGFRRIGLRMGEATDRFVAREIADFVLE